MADTNTCTVPDDPTEMLRLAAECVSRAAGAALTDRTTPPSEWYTRYGAVQQILGGLAELGHNAIDSVQSVIGRGGLAIDQLGTNDSPEAVLGVWIVRTNAAIFSIANAAGHWGPAHSAIGRIIDPVVEEETP